MGELGRAGLDRAVVVGAAVGEVWELISDWAGMSRWWLPAEAGGLRGPALVDCALIGEPGLVPRTRRMTLGNGAVVDETIVYQNDRTRRITYTKSDDATVSGYIATTYVDELPDGGSLVHISSRFDVCDPADSAAATARFDAVYTAMFEGYRRYFARD